MKTMNNEVSASFDTLLTQAGRTAAGYMADAVHAIDRRFGDGYAEKHPALLIAFMQVASADFNTALMKMAAQDIRSGLTELAAALAGK